MKTWAGFWQALVDLWKIITQEPPSGDDFGGGR